MGRLAEPAHQGIVPQPAEHFGEHGDVGRDDEAGLAVADLLAGAAWSEAIAGMPAARAS